jgi:hypothetical protein
MNNRFAAVFSLFSLIACSAPDRSVAQNNGGGAGSGAGGLAGAGGGGSGGLPGGSGGVGGLVGGGGAPGGGGTPGGGGAPSGGAAGGGGACTPPVSGPCDTYPPCGCTSGENCVFDLTTCPGSLCGSTKCIPSGGVPAYGACTSTTEWSKGSACIAKVCKEYCEPSSGCSGSTYRACLQINAQGVSLKDGFVCTWECDPRDPGNASSGFSPCPSGVQCSPRPDIKTGTTDCGLNLGPGGAGAACSLDSDCQAGFGCSASGCRRWCTLGGTDCATCTATSTPIYAQGAQLGFCL